MDQNPNEQEAVAIATAVERFVAEASPAKDSGGRRTGSWQRAALLEGVGAKETVLDSQGGERWPS